MFSSRSHRHGPKPGRPSRQSRPTAQGQRPRQFRYPNPSVRPKTRRTRPVGTDTSIWGRVARGGEGRRRQREITERGEAQERPSARRGLDSDCEYPTPMVRDRARRRSVRALTGVQVSRRASCRCMYGHDGRTKRVHLQGEQRRVVCDYSSGQIYRGVVFAVQTWRYRSPPAEKRVRVLRFLHTPTFR